MPINKFTIAAAVALIYMAIAIGLICADRKSSGGGNFINLQGMMSWLTVFPVAFPLEYFGHKINYRSNWQMGVAVAVCGVLVFALSSGIMALAQFLWKSASS